MKRLLFISLLLCVPFIAEAQYDLWNGVAEAGNDMIIMISDAADSVISKWIDYGDWKEYEGTAALWVAAYSYFDGISDAIIIKYQTRQPDDDKSNKRLSFWTTLDSLEAAEDTQIRYGAGDQIGVTFDVADKADPWGVHEQIRFLFYWAPGAADTVEISSTYSPVER